MKPWSALLIALLLTPLTAPCADDAARNAASPDVVIYSGVPCGIAASIMAARKGAKVVLIEPTRHVGGARVDN